MNKTHTIIQSVCLILIVIFLAIIAWENMYSFTFVPQVYDIKNGMQPGGNYKIYNLLHKFGLVEGKDIYLNSYKTLDDKLR
ncbi:MAG: hypothetical protein V1917_03995 [Candidatus Gottesmanbacteria bacterium]